MYRRLDGTRIVDTLERLRRLPLRVAAWALIAIIVFVAVEALLHLRLAPRWEEFARS